VSALVRPAADDTWRVAWTVPAGTAPIFSQALEALASALSAFELSEGGPWRLEALSEQEPDRAEVVARLALAATALGLPVPDVAIAPLPRQDWVAINQASFKPLRIGRFEVRPGHAPGSPGVRFAIVLDAGVAFGTGEHATTQGCLLALDALARAGLRPRRLLDLGCGTGILAIAAAKLWPGGPRIAARDIDADAVRMTLENARANFVPSRIAARRSHGDAGVGRGLDLVIANILARPLVHLAGGIARLVRRGGRVVLAGLLVEQERDVLRAYRARGLRLEARRHLGGWSILVLRRP
jgi:ribosomal protein L11 methyltransferase